MRASVLLFAIAMVFTSATFISPASATAATSVETCLRDADDRAAQRACIGQATTQCIDFSPSGETTTGMIRCADAERLQWEAFQERLIGLLRANETPSQRALLEASLEEHVRWTDARCAYEASIYEGGSLARVVAAQCFRDAVAENALYLYDRTTED